MHKNSGFLLMEFIAVLSLVSALLLVAGQWWQQQARLQQRQQWIDHTELLLQTTERFWLQQGRPPQQWSELDAVLDGATLVRPWQQPWLFDPQDSLLQLQITAPNAAQAQWFAGHFHGATVTAEQVTLRQWAPIIAATDTQYLYRVARPDQPELNQLAVNLQMQQHDLVGIGNLLASRASLQHLRTDSLMVDELLVDQLQTQLLSATSITTPYGDLQQLLDSIAAYEALWQECRLAGGCQ